jgi:hypothetical protein
MRPQVPASSTALKQSLRASNRYKVGYRGSAGNALICGESDLGGVDCAFGGAGCGRLSSGAHPRGRNISALAGGAAMAEAGLRTYIGGQR